VLADRWREGDLSEALWRRLAPDLALADHVHLQGWGEPLLHPLLPRMVRDAQGAGCRVGLTTNGDLLDDASPWLVEMEVDLVTVSVAGNEPGHPALRDGAGRTRLWETIAALAKRRGKRRNPRLQVAYLLTRENAEQLPAAVRDTAACGADELFVIHLDYTPSEHLGNRPAFGERGLCAQVPEALAKAEAAARDLDLSFRPPAVRPQPLLTCALNPLRLVFIGWNGRVAPCVNLGLPVHGAIPRWHKSGEVEIAPVSYGNLEARSLPELLQTSTCEEFTAPFVARLEAERRFLSGLGDTFGLEALERLDRADEAREQALAMAPFPQACRACPKQVGW
jgi:MoaA/NifB/PqqE/SkfB family radical SAM enzyme